MGLSCRVSLRSLFASSGRGRNYRCGTPCISLAPAIPGARHLSAREAKCIHVTEPRSPQPDGRAECRGLVHCRRLGRDRGRYLVTVPEGSFSPHAVFPRAASRRRRSVRFRPAVLIGRVPPALQPQIRSPYSVLCLKTQKPYYTF